MSTGREFPPPPTPPQGFRSQLVHPSEPRDPRNELDLVLATLKDELRTFRREVRDDLTRLEEEVHGLQRQIRSHLARAAIGVGVLLPTALELLSSARAALGW